MLDFSGKHWGNLRPTVREVDHRDIAEVFEDEERDGKEEMVNMISSGNIRLMPETAGINLATNPTAEQRKNLEVQRKRLTRLSGSVWIDMC